MRRRGVGAAKSELAASKTHIATATDENRLFFIMISPILLKINKLELDKLLLS